LGLKRVGDSATPPDNPAIRGMIATVGYLLKVEEVTHETI
jgi:ribosomal protein L30